MHNKKTAAWEWQYKTFPLNKGDSRDIPEGALFHHSVVERMQRFHTYRPENQLTVGKEGLNLNKVLLGSANGNTIGNAQREYPVEYNKKGLRDTEKVFRIVK